MGYTIPGWLDEILDFIGINFPNVDEDDYRDMADAMREFAEKFEGHGGDAHKAFSRILSSSEGWAVDSMEKHWNQIKASHLEKLPELARLFADACDVLAEIIEWMKHKAEAELAVMAAGVGLSIGLAWVTGGLSAVIGAAEIQAMRQAVKRVLDEAVDRIVDEVIAKLTEPVNAKLEAMVEDMVLDLADGAFHMPPANGSAGGGHGGKGGMHLNSADGAGNGPGKVTRIDHVEFEDGAGKVSRHGSDMHTAASDPLGRVKGAFGRSKGRDPFTKAFDSVLHGAIKGSEEALKKISKHITETVPERVKGASRVHKGKDHDVRTKVDGIDAGKRDGGKDGGHPKGDGQRGRRPDSLKDALANARAKAMALTSRRCKTDPVDVASGEMVLAQTDLSLPGALPLVLRRTHISGYRYGRCFGTSWASTLDERLELTGSGAAWAREDGSILVYPRLPTDNDDEVLPVEGERIPLVYEDRNALGEITYATRDPWTGVVHRFVGSPYTSGGLYWLADTEDRNGNTLHFVRDAEGLPSAVVHHGGYDVRIGSDRARGRVTSVELRTPEGPVPVASYGYEGGDLAEVRSFAETASLRFTYDDEHRVTSWTDRNDHTYAYVYDSAGRVMETVGPDGALSSRFSYDTTERLTRFTDSTGAVTVTRLNALGQTVAETDPLGHTIRFEWDRYDNLLERTDELGRTARFTWDECGNLTAVRFPDGTEATTRYDGLNLPVTVVEADGTTWRQDFDELGNRVRVVAPDGTETRFTYDARGALLSLTAPDGTSTHFANDPAGLVRSNTDALGATASVERDAFGRPARFVAPGGATTLLEWLPQGWLARRTHPDGSTEHWTWDAEGNCTSHTGPAGAVTRFEYTHFDLLAARTGADGARYTFAYDTELRLTEVVNPQGLTWCYRYDAAGGLIRETDFDGRSVEYTYDPTGLPVARTTPLGARITSSYDVMGRVVEKDVAGSVTHYTYDQAGRIESLTSPTSTLSLERDVIGRVVAETVDGCTTRFAYDAMGHRTSRTTPTGAVTHYTYDTVGNRTGLLTDGNTLTFTHDAWGKELSRSFGPAGAPVTLTSTWNEMGRLTSRLLTAGGHTLRDRAYGYRSDGCLERITDQESGTSQRFELDPVGRPLRVTADNWTENYAYDSAGNQVRAAWPQRAGRAEGCGERTYEGTRVVSAGQVHHEYDAAGRTVLRRRKRLSRKPDSWHYTWDEENRLVACITPDGTRWTYSYDPLGRRTAKRRLADDGRTVVHCVQFTWDGTRLAEQTDSAHGVTTTWDYEGHRPLTQLERRPSDQGEVDARFFAIVTDLLGTPSELVDETGTIAWRSRSTVWGTTGWNRDATAYTPLRMPGQYDDPETGFHYNYQRHYDPETGRYASPDPLGLDPAPNPVAYVTNPYTLMDPEGLIAKGCTEKGGWYSGMKPANLLDDNKKRINPVDQEINHIPAKASYSHLDLPGFRTSKNGGGAGMGPAIRMDAEDHRDLTSTGSSHESEAWRAKQRALIDAGRWDQAMKMDIDEIRELYGDKYDKHIKDMVGSLENNRKFQAMLEKKGWKIDYDLLK
jgi:RHS repeat-associated protein